MAVSSCLTCHRVIPLGESYCREHRLRKARDSRQWRKARSLFLAMNPQCSKCGHTGSPDNPLELDHIVPLSKGGKDEPSNWDTLCRKHNAEKKDKLLDWFAI